MKYIVANWKMNLNLEEVTQWLSEFEKILATSSFGNEIILAPSFTHAEKVYGFAKQNNISCAMQDVSIQEKGAHTGEVGAFQIKDYANYCIVGHSERKENKETVIAKRDICLGNGVTPIVCFTDPEKINDYYNEGVILAWEDPKNISKNGVYREKNPDEIVEEFSQMKSALLNAQILYGGSVHEKNVTDISQIDGVSGILVGNASLDPKHFTKLITAFE